MTDENDGGLFEMIQTVEGFLDSTNAYPKEWCNVIRTMVISINTYKSQSVDMNNLVHQGRQKVESTM